MRFLPLFQLTYRQLSSAWDDISCLRQQSVAFDAPLKTTHFQRTPGETLIQARLSVALKQATTTKMRCKSVERKHLAGASRTGTVRCVSSTLDAGVFRRRFQRGYVRVGRRLCIFGRPRRRAEDERRNVSVRCQGR